VSRRISNRTSAGGNDRLRRLRAAAPQPGERLLWTLGLGAFGLAWPTATVAAFLPTVLHDFTSSDTLIGLVLASEGVFALLLPLAVGPLSDATMTPLGRRRPYLVFAIPPMALSLALVAFMPTLWTTTLVLFVFFFGNYVYEPPWRSLYADLVPAAVAGRAQAASHVMRGVAFAGALVGGGLALAAWAPLPFVMAAGATALACGLVPVLVHEVRGGRRRLTSARAHLSAPWQLVRSDPLIRRFLVANTAWETTFAGMRTFVVLYIVEGLGQPLAVSSAVLAVVAIGYALAAGVLGPFADRLGLARVILWASVVYGVGLFATGFATRWHAWFYAIVLLVAVAGGAVTTLAWGLLFKLMPGHDQGAVSALAVMTRGLGLLVGPPLAGLAVDVLDPLFAQTNGYGAVWPTVALPVLAVIPLVVTLRRAEVALAGRPRAG
jgi:MFS family permease